MDYPRYNPDSPNDPLSEEELQALDTLLQDLPSEASMPIDAIDGYLTALLVGPAEVLGNLPTADWLPLVWGGDGDNGAPFPSNQKRKRTTVLILRHLQSIACQLRDNPEAWEPIFSVADDGEREWADAGDWCTGFLQAVDLAPDAWTPFFDHPTLGPALLPIALLGGDIEADAATDLDNPEVRDQLSRAAADAVIQLLQDPSSN